MTTTRLGTMLLALALVPAAILSVQPANANANAAVDDVEYCHSDYVISQNPYCTPLPPKKNYKGEPIAVQDDVKSTGLNCEKLIRVLSNDRIEKKQKIKRIEITFREFPKKSGIHASVTRDRRIRLRFDNTAWGGYGVRYRLVDYKGRKSDDTRIDIKVGFGYTGGADLC